MRNPHILVVVWFFVHISVGSSLGHAADLSVHVTAHKSTLVLGEPLFITARVRNEGKMPVKVYRQSSPSYERRSKNPFLVMMSTDGKKYESWSDSLRVRRKTSPIELAPAAELTTDLAILFSGRHGFVFAQPGAFWVSVKVIDTDMASFQADPIQVTVTHPGRENLDPWSVLGSATFARKYGELIQTPWRTKLGVDDLRQCDDIIGIYPDSIYAEYLALYLGRWYLEGPQRDKIQAHQYLEIAKSMVSSDFLSAKVMKVLERKEAGDKLMPPE